jgi:hypothetical protein
MSMFTLILLECVSAETLSLHVTCAGYEGNKCRAGACPGCAACRPANRSPLLKAFTKKPGGDRKEPLLLIRLRSFRQISIEI